MEHVEVNLKSMMIIIFPDKGRVVIISKLTGGCAGMTIETFEDAVKEAIAKKGYGNL